MNILTILGSPRKSAASTAIAKAFNDTAESNGAAVTTYYLNGLDYKGCQGCYACKNGKESCVLTDGLTPIFTDMESADVVVFATPIYYGDITAQLKGLFDRFYATIDPSYRETGVFTSRLPGGKKSLFIYTQGADEKTHAEIPERYDYYLGASGFDERRIIRDCNRTDETDCRPSEASLQEARDAAKAFTGCQA